MTHLSYSLRRVFWFVWRWQADHDGGKHTETGLSLGRRAARWSGRSRLREARAQRKATGATAPIPH
jgi:hypothetical protein